MLVDFNIVYQVYLLHACPQVDFFIVICHKGLPSGVESQNVFKNEAHAYAKEAMDKL